MNRSLWAPALLAVWMGACSSDGPTGPDATVAEVRVSPDAAQLVVGQTVQLTATPVSAAGDALSDRTVVWTSRDSSIATVSATGLVTAIHGGGTAVIDASCEGESGAATVRVTYFDAAEWTEILTPVAETLNDPVWLAQYATAYSISRFLRGRRTAESVPEGVFPASVVGVRFGFSGEPTWFGDYEAVGPATDPQTVEFLLYAADTATWQFVTPARAAGTLTIRPADSTYQVSDATQVTGVGVFSTFTGFGLSGGQSVLTEVEFSEGGLHYWYDAAVPWLSEFSLAESFVLPADGPPFQYENHLRTGPAFSTGRRSATIGTDLYEEFSNSADKQLHKRINGEEVTGTLTSEEEAAIALIVRIFRSARWLTQLGEPYWGLLDYGPS